MRSSPPVLKTRTVLILTISVLSCLAPTAAGLPTTQAAPPHQPPALAKMGIVPPHVHEHLAKHPSLSDEQRAHAQKNLDKSREISQQKHEQSVRPRVPYQVLERLARDESLASGCSDDVKREINDLLKYKNRFPQGTEASVSDNLKAVVDANPALWEPAADQIVDDGETEEKK